MTRALEEQLGTELDALWQAALFLSGGDDRRAEAMLVDTVSSASDDYSGALEWDAAPDLLEQYLVRRFFQSSPPLGARPVPGGERDLPAARLDVDTLLEDAGAIPPRPRAALWLVIVRRKSYAEAAEILDIEGEALQRLLQYRDAFMAQTFGRSARRLTRPFSRWVGGNR